jgi:cation:H+ antiporter
MWYFIALSFFGLVALVSGARAFVAGASSLAQRFKIPPLIIGLTLVAFGTSAPELFFSSFASWHGSSALALGNVLGSNLVNTLLVVGISAIFSVLSFRKQLLRLELPFLLVIYALIWLLPESPALLGQRDGWLLIIVGFAFFAFLIGSKRTLLSHDSGGPDYSVVKSTIFILLGLAALAIGSQALVEGASGLAAAIHISEAFIALTVVAIGTSLPELATSAVAAYHGHDDIAIGNIIGSNIINICFVLGIAAAISPISFSHSAQFDLGYNVLAIVSLITLLIIGRRKISWRGGLVLIVLYAFYFSYIIIRG